MPTHVEEYSASFGACAVAVGTRQVAETELNITPPPCSSVPWFRWVRER